MFDKSLSSVHLNKALDETIPILKKAYAYDIIPVYAYSFITA